MPPNIAVHPVLTPEGFRASQHEEAASALFAGRGDILRFEGLVEVIEAEGPKDVAAALERIERGVAAGLHAAGYVAYEAAPAFDGAMLTHEPGGKPVLAFALYEHAFEEPAETLPSAGMPPLPWKAAMREDQYQRVVERIREYIAAGDAYQVNFTFPLVAEIDTDADACFGALYARQPTDYAAHLRFGSRHVMSFSPELFFKLDGTRIVTKPMKGTRRRGLWPEADEVERDALHRSGKDRAENVMIVDLLRNDLGKICETGSVSVDRLFDVERYETLWQMTSTVSGRTEAGLSGILGALFPCGSVTGAPKIRAMEIIRETETAPRGVYCGAVGYWSPGRQAQFNVAIRTAVYDEGSREFLYSVGSGLTWDSDADSEYRECLLKAEALELARPAFELLESIRWDGLFHLLDRHLQRMRESAMYFGFAFDEARARQALDAALVDRDAPAKVRLLLDRYGVFRVDVQALPESEPVRVAWAKRPVDSGDVFLYHKTTHRAVYDHALEALDDADEALLWNERGELTESATSNVVVELDDELFTPPVECGLLAGTLRAELIESGKIEERVLSRSEVESTQKIWLINSVRGWREARWT